MSERPAPRTSRPPPRGDVLHGIPGAPGIAQGRVVVLGPFRHGYPRKTASDADLEIERFRGAAARAAKRLRDIATSSSASTASSVLEAYVLMVQDPTLDAAVVERIRGERRCAEWAVALSVEAIAEKLATAKDAYLRERSRDIEFVGEHILRGFVEAQEDARSLPDGPLVVVARDLSPADTAALGREHVVAYVTEGGSRTSHTSITARALKVPAVVGVSELLDEVASGDVVIVDGIKGTVTVHPSPLDVEEAERRAERYRIRASELREAKERAATTTDGATVTLLANVEHAEEASRAREEGAEGVGLYRTEYLYIDRPHPPSEDEQLAVFRAVLDAMHDLPVVLRTFDLGGDKFTSSFMLPHELNPMLGLRAVRLALSRPEVFLEHLRAMVRASAFGDVRIMVPMVAGLGELRKVRALLDRAIDEVRARGEPCADTIPLGVMIEVPSAALMADHFAREAAFLSIGTNDLIQYTMAVDRASRRLAYLASPFDPSIARLIRGVVRAASEHDCPVSVCGAMAADPLGSLLLLGLGVHRLSMEPSAIPEIREAIRRTSLAEARAVAERALALSSAEEVEHVVAEAFAPRLFDILMGELETPDA
jgi:phosphotransferase system enzyme I (PtsI)